jgi:selenocysteine-specific elongation factor
MILGTAGHIDHGKTTLVKALTGVDTDRLPEEKRRGITIVLGFAPLELDGIGTVGVVDVPGHEAFVRTMVAGATGIDLALFVIAADEGIMPQTREHLAVLEHLGVSRGVVALTKSDMVDADWLEMVRDEVHAFLAASPLATSDIIPVSATKGLGIAELRAALAKAAASVPQKQSGDIFRLPVDRVFTVKGTGTVVTGTVWSGELRDGATVTVLPERRELRVRGLQNHGHAVDTIHAGDRAAIALAGVDVAEISRSSVVVSDAHWEMTKVARAAVTIDSAVTLRPRTRLRLHVGTSDVSVRVVITSPREAGTRDLHSNMDGRVTTLPAVPAVPVRLRFESPLTLRAGDRFVLRGGTPVSTIGGGVIIDPLPAKRTRPIPASAKPADLLRLYIEEAGPAGLDAATLPQRLGLKPSQIDPLVSQLKSTVIRVGSVLWSAELLDRVSKSIRKQVAEHHKSKPLEKGAPVADLRAAAKVPAQLFDHVLQDLVASKKLSSDAGLIRQPGFSAELSGTDDALASAALATLTAAGPEPPSIAELIQKHGDKVANVLRFLERSGAVVKVEADRYYEVTALTALIARLGAVMSESREYSPAELREALSTSRKFLIPFLEYCDRRGLTIRSETGRRWKG